MASALDIDWVDALPFHHEIVHTSVLRFLLKTAEPDRVNDLVKRLTGLDGVSKVDDVRFETSLRRNRRLDLTANLSFESVPSRRLAMEIKTDSEWTWDQLWRSTPKECVALLVAVGITHLTIRPAELALIEEEHPKSCPAWKLVGPNELADAIDACITPKGSLSTYVDSLRDEARLHDEALAMVGQIGSGWAWDPDALSGSASARGDRSDSRDILITAYLNRALASIDNTSRPEWRWGKQRSGHLVMKAIEVRPDDSWRTWLEIRSNGDHGPIITVKVSDTIAKLQNARDEVARLLVSSGVEGSAPSNRVGTGHKTATAWSVPLHELAPTKLRSLISHLEAALQTRTGTDSAKT